MWVKASDKELRECFEGLTRIAERLANRHIPEDDFLSLRKEIRQIVKECVREELAAWRSGTSSAMEDQLGRYPLREVELITLAGTVRGTMAEAANGVVEIREQGGGIVLVSTDQIVGLEWQ